VTFSEKEIFFFLFVTQSVDILYIKRKNGLFFWGSLVVLGVFQSLVGWGFWKVQSVPGGGVGSCIFCRVLGAPVGSWDLKQGDETESQKKWREIPGRESMCWASPGVTWPRVLNPLSSSWRFSDSSMQERMAFGGGGA
jgi:hypothetical protein